MFCEMGGSGEERVLRVFSQLLVVNSRSWRWPVPLASRYALHREQEVKAVLIPAR